MQLSTAYSASCGLKIHKPEVYDIFYPFVEEDFITIDTGNNNYGNWEEVINLIYPYLHKKNISIFQLGEKESATIPNVNRTNGALLPNQKSYLIKKSKLHLSSNNYTAQVAAALNKQLICLVGHENQAIPFDWGDPDKYDFIYPNPDAPHENFIKPEKIAQLILNKLEIDFKYDYETVFIGDKYKDGIQFVEGYLSGPINLQKFNLQSFLIRTDLNFCEQKLQEQLQRGKASIYCNQAINMDIIAGFKENIIEIIYEVKEDNLNGEFCEKVQNLGIKCNLISFLPEEEINSRKLEYMEMGNILPQLDYSFDSLPNYKDLNINELYFKSKRYIIKDDDVYLSQESLKKGIKSNHYTDIQKLVDGKNFWRTLDALLILKKIN